MLESVSLKLFQNEEFLNLLLLCGVVFSVIYIAFHCIPLPAFHLSERKNSYTKTDRFYLSSVVALYTILSFWKLGASRMPVTTWQPSIADQSFVLRIPENSSISNIYAIYAEGDNHALEYGYQLGFHRLKIEGSYDLDSWQPVCELEEGSIYQYTIIQGNWTYPFYRITAPDPHTTLTEIGFWIADMNRFAAVQVVEDPYADSVWPASLVIDEQELLTAAPTYYHQSYFDEVYHPRNAWEIAEGQYMYATVHPLLGTCLIALSIKLFGMNPLAWRLPGALFGVFMLPLLYRIIKMLFQESRWCLTGIVLLAADFMHLTTSRIATLEPFSVFFILLMFRYMLEFYLADYYKTPLKKKLVMLLLSGISMGLAIAVKWTACYSAVGLALILFTKLFRTEKEAGKNSVLFRRWKADTLMIISCCFLFFILIPIIIYWSVYLFAPVWKDGWSIQNVWHQNLSMFRYHRTLEASHPYESKWYMWLLDIRPIWYYYNGSTDTRHTIACFSNPIICWSGLAAVLYTCYDFVKKKSPAAYVILIGYFSALLPWTLVDRCVFAYHFYPTSVFMILAIVYALYRVKEHRHAERIRIAYLVTAVLLLVLFMPILTGFGTSEAYIKFLEWFPSWYFG